MQELHDGLSGFVFRQQYRHAAGVYVVVALDIVLVVVLHVPCVVPGEMWAGNLIVPQFDAGSQGHVRGIHLELNGAQGFSRSDLLPGKCHR